MGCLDKRHEKRNRFLAFLGSRSGKEFGLYSVLSDQEGNWESVPTRMYLGNNLSALAIGDANGDHRDDIAVLSQNPPQILVFLGVGQEQDGQSQPDYVVPFGDFLSTIDMAFLHADDGDKWLDLCIGASDGTVRVFRGNGEGAFGEPNILYAGPGLEGLRVVDLDGDVKEEILVSTEIGLLKLKLELKQSQVGE